MKIQAPIKILFVSHGSSLYGAERVLLNLISEIDKKNFFPSVVFPQNSNGPMKLNAIKLGIPVFNETIIHWVPFRPFVSHVKQLSYLLRLLSSLNNRCKEFEKIIIKNRINLVYTNTITCIEGAIAAYRLKIPHIWHIHEHFFKNRQLKKLLPYSLYRFVSKKLNKTAIFCSKSVAKDYIGFSEKQYIVYNGLSIKVFPDKKLSKYKLQEELKLDKFHKLVAVVAAILPGKGHFTFLDAAKEVAKKYENVDFLIVGHALDFNYFSILREKIGDDQLDSKVHILGWRDDVLNIIAGIDVLVISSEQESFGLTAIEALSSGTPVVATRCGGPEEIIQNGTTGMLIPINDHQAMASAIEILLTDNNLANRISSEGKAHVINNFSQKNFVKRIEKIIKKSLFQFVNENVKN